mgnify:FL=1
MPPPSRLDHAPQGPVRRARLGVFLTIALAAEEGAQAGDDIFSTATVSDAILQPAVDSAPSVPETVPSDELTRDGAAVRTDDDGPVGEADD